MTSTFFPNNKYWRTSISMLLLLSIYYGKVIEYKTTLIASSSCWSHVIRNLNTYLLYLLIKATNWSNCGVHPILLSRLDTIWYIFMEVKLLVNRRFKNVFLTYLVNLFIFYNGKISWIYYPLIIDILKITEVYILEKWYMQF